LESAEDFELDVTYVTDEVGALKALTEKEASAQAPTTAATEDVSAPVARYDLIFMDYLMPEKNGDQVTAALRAHEQTRKYPVPQLIVGWTSNADQPEIVTAMKQAGVHFVLPKTLRATVLQQLLVLAAHYSRQAVAFTGQQVGADILQVAAYDANKKRIFLTESPDTELVPDQELPLFKVFSAASSAPSVPPVAAPVFSAAASDSKRDDRGPGSPRLFTVPTVDNASAMSTQSAVAGVSSSAAQTVDVQTSTASVASHDGDSSIFATTSSGPSFSSSASSAAS
jgi:CheY-like chemotaxis protein